MLPVALFRSCRRRCRHQSVFAAARRRRIVLQLHFDRFLVDGHLGQLLWRLTCERRNEMIDIAYGQAQCLNLRQLGVTRHIWYAPSQLVEGLID